MNGGGATGPGAWTEEQSPGFGEGNREPQGPCTSGNRCRGRGHYLWRRSPGAGVAGGEPSTPRTRALRFFLACSKTQDRGFPGGPGVKNLLPSAWDMGLIPGWETKILHASGQ